MSFVRKWKGLFIVICSVCILVSSGFGIGFLVMQDYLIKNINPDHTLILYMDAQDAMLHTKIAGLATWYLGLFDMIFPSYFANPSDYADVNNPPSTFDPTKETVTFKVLGVNSSDKTVNLRFWSPAGLQDLMDVNAQIQCQQNLTHAAEANNFTDAQLQNVLSQLLAGKQVDSNALMKKLDITKPVFDFISDLMNRPDVRNGQKQVFIKAWCTSVDCTALGVQCSITVQ